MSDRTPATPSSPTTVNELCDRCLVWAEDYYQTIEDGKRVPTGQAKNIGDAMRAIRAVAGQRDPRDIVAEDLCACQQWMLQQRKRNGQAWTRNHINATINRIRSVMRWAAKPPRRWISTAVIQDLELVDPLKFARSEARESQDVQPISEEQFKDAQAALAKEQQQIEHSAHALRLLTMIEVNWYTGMRPGELVRIRRPELSIETAQLSLFEKPVEIMVYRPARHKTLHHGFDRVVFMGPEARRLIEDHLIRVPSTESRLFPYSAGSYRQALQRLLKRHRQTHWSPNQIRHSFATRMRKTENIDVLQVLMGHQHRQTTEIYAQPDAAAAISAIWRHG